MLYLCVKYIFLILNYRSHAIFFYFWNASVVLARAPLFEYSVHLFEYSVDLGDNGEYLLAYLHLFIIESLTQTVGIQLNVWFAL